MKQENYPKNDTYILIPAYRPDHLLNRINSDYINDKYRDDFVGVVRNAEALLSK